MDDIVPGLLSDIEKSFDEKTAKSSILKQALNKLEAKKAGYSDVNDFAVEVGKILASSMGNVVTGDNLPDGRMYFNIAQRLLDPTLKKNFDLITGYASDVQSLLNDNAGLGLKAQISDYPQDKLDGLVNRLASEPDFDKVKWLLNGPLVTFSQSIVDDCIKKNVDFHAGSGLRPKITRTVIGKACYWCKNLAGNYKYSEAPDDIYRRHERCRCIVEYDPGDGKKQDVWSKRWKDPKESANLEARKAIGAQQVYQHFVSIKKEMLQKFDRKLIGVSDQNFWVHNGVNYEVDGKNVVLDYSASEKAVANWLTDTFGAHVQMIPRVNFPSGIKTPDYLMNGIPFDLKEVTGKGKNAIDGNLRKAKAQSENVLLDFTNSKLTTEEIMKQLENIYKSGRRGVDTIIIKRGNVLVDVIKK